MEKLHLCVKDSRYLFSAALSIFTCLAVLPFDLEQQAGAISLIFAALCAAGIIAFGILLQRSLHERLYNSKLPLKDAILIDLIRLGITALVLIVASVAFGLSAVVLQFTIFHLIGFSASVATLEVLAALIALFTLPVIAIVFFAPISNSQEVDTPSKDANRFKRLISKLACLARVEMNSTKEQISVLYASILGISIAVLILGLILQSIAALNAVHIVLLFVSFITQTLLGFAWICALYDLIVDAALKRNAFDALSTLHLRKLLTRLSRVSIKGTACILTFALAFSMLGTSFQAFAEEMTKDVSAADPTDIADIYTPENTPQTSDPKCIT